MHLHSGFFLIKYLLSQLLIGQRYNHKKTEVKKVTKPSVQIVGLGPGSIGQLSIEAWELFKDSSEIYVRTIQHPTISKLPQHLSIRSFDHLYEQEKDYSKVYELIVDEVIKLGQRPEGVIYAVPGHPFIVEVTGPEIFKRCKEQGIPVKVIDGISFLEPTLKAISTDILPQLMIVDALEIMDDYFPKFPPNVSVLIAQVHSIGIAGALKITLEGQYDDKQMVYLVHSAGTDDEKVEEIYLHQIDQSEHFGNLTSLYIPALEVGTSFEEFQNLIAQLRSPEGCAWDREQDHQSLRTNLMEEMYEALDAIDKDDPELMKEEFGDLLLQIVLQTQIAIEYGEFKMTDVISGIFQKLVRRHPHVFTGLDIEAPGEIIKNWEKIKEKERNEIKGNDKGLLDGVVTSMPALAVADNYQKRAARVGFDWDEIKGAMDKLEEEIAEFQSAQSPEEKADEIGDMLFAVANIARWMNVDPETALRATNKKFKERFGKIEAEARKRGISLSDMSLEEMEVIWENSKNK